MVYSLLFQRKMQLFIWYRCAFTVITLTSSISALTCYNCPLHHYDFFITPGNIPVFSQCSATITTQKFCSLNIYSDDNGNTSKLRANPNQGVERANVSYISTGFDVPKSFDKAVSFGILYQCMTDNCNNPEMVLKRILEATTIETYKPPQVEQALDQSSLATTLLCTIFSNFTSADECRPPFQARGSANIDDTCSTYCVTAIKIDPVDLRTERVCAYCEREPQERFVYIDERIHLLDQRISYSQELDYSCNASNFCNSLENIRQLRQRYKIEFDFDVFFGSKSTTMTTTTTNSARNITTIGNLQCFVYFIIVLLLFLKQ